MHQRVGAGPDPDGRVRHGAPPSNWPAPTPVDVITQHSAGHGVPGQAISAAVANLAAVDHGQEPDAPLATGMLALQRLGDQLDAERLRLPLADATADPQLLPHRVADRFNRS
jgi:hypothetical protein